MHINLRRSARWASAAAGVLTLGMLGTAPAMAADPVDIDAAYDGFSSITVHKHVQPAVEGGPASGADLGEDGPDRPLPGVDFHLYRLDIDLDTTEGWALADAIREEIEEEGASPVPNGALTQVTVGELEFDLVTDGGDVWTQDEATDPDGIAVFDALGFGVYLVIEGDSVVENNIVTKAAPFLVSLPFALGDSEWSYDVHVYPKNAVSGITKTAEALTDPESPNYAVGDVVRWTITADLPRLAGTDSLESFSIVDELDDRLAYQEASASVVVNDAAGAPVTLPAEPYTLGLVDGDLVLEFTEAGLATLEADAQGGTVTLVFDTTVASIGADGVIPNEATVFVNDGEASTSATTAFGQLTLFKYAENDDTEVGLAGATFELYRDADLEIPVTFAGSTGPWTATTGTNGVLELPVLKPGTYYLAETETPDGYRPLEGPVEVTIVAGLTNEATGVNYVAIENTQIPAWELPLTGAAGTILFVIAGVGIIAIAVGAGIRSRRRQLAAAIG